MCKVEEWGKSLDEHFRGDAKLKGDLHVLKEQFGEVFFEWDANSLYPTAMYYPPLPLGTHLPVGTDDEEEMRSWLEEEPLESAPNMVGGTCEKFPVSHYGIYLVDLDPPDNWRELPTCVIPKQDKSIDEEGFLKVEDDTIDWHNFRPIQKEWIDSFTLWTAINIQGWKWINGYKAFRYHCGFDIGPTFKGLFTERLKLKKTNPLFAETYKLIMNSAYGRFSMKDTKSDVVTASLEDGLTKDKFNYKTGEMTRFGGLNDVKEVLSISDNGQVTYRSKKGHVNTEPNQLGAACTSAARTIMHLVGGKEVLATPISEQKATNTFVYYQDTDSQYASLGLTRKWAQMNLFGNELGQFKNDTVKGGDGVGVLGYFLAKKLKCYYARNTLKGTWHVKVTFKGVGKRELPTTALQVLLDFQNMDGGNVVEFDRKFGKTKKSLDIGKWTDDGYLMGGLDLSYGQKARIRAYPRSIFD